MELRSGRATWGLTRDKRSVRWGGRGRWPFLFPLCLGHPERKGDFFSLQELEGGRKRSSRVIEDWICCCGPVARSVHAALLLLQRPLPREPPEAVFEMLTPHSSPQDWTKLKKDSTAATRIGQPGLGGALNFGVGKGKWQGCSNLTFHFFFPSIFFILHRTHPTEAIPSISRSAMTFDDATAAAAVKGQATHLPRLRPNHAAKPRREAVAAAVVDPGVTQEATVP